MSNLTKEQRDLRSRQLNPADDLFWKTRGYAGKPENWEDLLEEMGYYSYDDETSENSDNQEDEYYDEEDTDEEEYAEDEEQSDEEYETEEEYQERIKNQLRSRQMNPCDVLFWTSRGYPDRPRNWRQLVYNE